MLELHLSGLTGTARHPNSQKIGIMYFLLKIGYIGNLKFSCYYVQYVTECELFDHAWCLRSRSHNNVPTLSYSG